MKKRIPNAQTLCLLSATLGFSLVGAPTSWAQATATPASSTKPAEPDPTKKPEEEDVYTLSPFEVGGTKDAGYYAENTLAGSRLNTNIGDLAASITVVTKQQMEDTASLDINDVFRYEASTEGSSTYTPVVTDRGTSKDTIAGYSLGNDGGTTTNAQSNRVRGIAAPDAALNNYPTNSRVPFDSYNIQSIEITRGPNSLLFGLGSAAGIVNQSAQQAVLDRNSGEVSMRTDQNGSFRGTVSFNRALIEGKLAVFGALLYNDQQFERKPSSDFTRRQYGAITFKPFKKTTLSAFAENYENYANRPNFLTPRDQVTPWKLAGRPVYDPVARTVTVQDSGRVVGPYVISTLSPGFVTGNQVGGGALTTLTSPQFLPGIQFEDTARPLRLLDNNAVVGFFARNPQVAGVNYPTAQTNPATTVVGINALWPTAGDPRFLIADRQWSSSTNLPNPTTVINGTTYTYGSYQGAGVTDKSIYDWTKYNLVQTNFGTLKAANYNVEFEQRLLSNLTFRAGWLRQDISGVENYTMGQLTGNTVSIDTNVRRPDGTANPYLGLPFISEGVGGGLDTFYSPTTDDNYRAMLAYELDFTKDEGWKHWLGHHRLFGMWSSQYVNRAVERWRNGFVDGDADAKLRYVTNLNLPAQQLALNSALMRKYYLASPGDAQGVISHSSGGYYNLGWDRPYTSQVQVYNFATGGFQQDTVVENALFSSAGSFRTQRQVRSWTLAAQNYLWEDRLVTTLGWRRDAYRARITSTGALTDVKGVVYEPALPNSSLYANGFSGLINHDIVMNRWWRWDELKGDTKTYGGALRPLRDMGLFKPTDGKPSIISEFFNGLTLYYNHSENFNPPATFQTDYFKLPLPKPTGDGKDMGFGFNILGNKLVGRVTWYQTETQFERTGSAGTLLGRLAYSDTTTGLAWASAVQRIRNGANTAVSNWNSNAVNDVSDAVNQQKIYDLIKLPLNYYSSGVSIGGTQDSKAKGMELQLTYNPSNNWTIKVTGDKQRTTYDNVVPQYDTWLAQRLPIWQTNAAPEIADFTDGGGVRYSLKNFWTGYGFTNVSQITNTDGNTSPQGYFNNVVASQVALAKALQGVTAPDQRKYHGSVLTNYRFSEGKLKGFSIGGSERWESKAAIGFLGKVGDPLAPTVISVADPTKPVYDSGNYYTDLWVAYGRKIFGDQIGWKVQLNINNAFESGHLQPTAVNFDGTPWSFRIIDPRQIILTSTFTF